jgi:hypothetical protein
MLGDLAAFAATFLIFGEVITTGALAIDLLRPYEANAMTAHRGELETLSLAEKAALFV